MADIWTSPPRSFIRCPLAALAYPAKPAEAGLTERGDLAGELVRTSRDKRRAMLETLLLAARRLRKSTHTGELFLSCGKGQKAPTYIHPWWFCDLCLVVGDLRP